MISKEYKRLAEVDFSIPVVSKQAVRGKSIRYGHPSTLHLWWARRLLASNEAMTRKLASLGRKYDAQFKVVFDAIRELMRPPTPKTRRLGFQVSKKAAKYGH
jgi:adenine-specific DNA methylase